MRNREDYEHALRIVDAFVSEWDPCELLSGGAPKDEYSAEVAKLVTHIPRISSPSTAAHALSAVFSSQFQPEGFNEQQCAETGARFYQCLLSASLVARG